MARTSEEQKEANKIFDSFRNDLLKRELSNTESYDKAILTLSASSLGFSLTAIKFIVALEKSCHIWMLKLGWALLVFSVIFSLLAYLVSNKAISKQLDLARMYYIEGNEDAFNKKNIFKNLNSFLNSSTGFLMAVAIVLIVSFVGINI